MSEEEVNQKTEQEASVEPTEPTEPEVKILYTFTVKVFEDGNIQIDPSEGAQPMLIEAACRDVYGKLHDQRLIDAALQRLASNMAGLFSK